MPCSQQVIVFSKCKYILNIISDDRLLRLRPILNPMEHNYYLHVLRVNLCMIQRNIAGWLVAWLIWLPHGLISHILFTFCLRLCINHVWTTEKLGLVSLIHDVPFFLLVKLGGSSISLKTKKHDVISRSSTEAKYRTMVDAVYIMDEGFIVVTWCCSWLSDASSLWLSCSTPHVNEYGILWAY